VDDVRAATAAAYDQIVDEFVRRTSDLNVDFVEFRDAFVAAVTDDGRVIDVGCGPGRDSTYFHTRGLHVVGVDASKNMAAYAHGDGVAMAVADMRALPLAFGSLDGIWSAASLLHVPREEVASTLASWRELLRPQSVLGLSTSLGTDEGWEACPYDPTKQRDPAGLRRWFVHHDQDVLLALIEDAGFDVTMSRERASNRRWLQVLARVGD
jgi:SAM-dependent methyltransferase